jgi:hypothetical protein
VKTIKTGAWSATVPKDHIKIGISRGNPRGQKAGYRLYRALAPGPWFHSVSVAEFVKRYNGEILGALDPRAVMDDIERLADGRTPILCCFEPTDKIIAGTCWCHRSLAAHWLNKTLGVRVREFGAPRGFNPLANFPAF